MWLSLGCADDCVDGMLRFGNANESSALPYGLMCCCILGWRGWNKRRWCRWKEIEALRKTIIFQKQNGIESRRAETPFIDICSGVHLRRDKFREYSASSKEESPVLNDCEETFWSETKSGTRESGEDRDIMSQQWPEGALVWLYRG